MEHKYSTKYVVWPKCNDKCFENVCDCAAKIKGAFLFSNEDMVGVYSGKHSLMFNRYFWENVLIAWSK